MSYFSTKTYGHELGLSCAFRQHKANSHCAFIHGYALSFRFTFKAALLDDRNWVVDFGGLSYLKKKLIDAFDHKLLVAEDDPRKDEICMLGALGLADVVVVDNVGCEAFAQQAFMLAFAWLKENRLLHRVAIHSVEVSEHGANSAIYSQ